MSSSGSPFPPPPPLFKMQWGHTEPKKNPDAIKNGDTRQDVYLSTPAIGFLTQLWAALAGSGGLIPILINIPIPVAGSVAAYDVVAINGTGQAFAPDITVVADGKAIIGIATSTGSVGSTINVQPVGIVSNSAWTWTPGVAIWCGAGGVLTQTAPTGAGNFVRRMGVSMSATEMMISIGELVELT